MKKILLSLVALLFFITPAFADVFIAKEHRVRNWSPGYCAWCCLETVANHQNITPLKNLAHLREKDPDYVEWNWNGYQWVGTTYAKNTGCEAAVEAKLKSLKVKYAVTHYDSTAMAKASKTNGAVVFMKKCSQWDGDHAIILTHYDDKMVEFIDPNDCIYYSVSRKWFDHYWYGVAITLEK